MKLSKQIKGLSANIKRDVLTDGNAMAHILLFAGWCFNLFSLIGASMTPFAIVQVIGVFAFPIGSIIGLGLGLGHLFGMIVTLIAMVLV